eukprot:3151278-Rhodomonas_salina.2
MGSFWCSCNAGYRGSSSSKCTDVDECTFWSAMVPVLQISSSPDADTSCVLLETGAVKCWGQNVWGQLGLGDTHDRGDNPGEVGDALPAVELGTGRTAVSVAGGSVSCAILDDGSLKCWGKNEYGQLGLGDLNHRGDGAGEMGDALPAIDLGSGLTVASVSAGAYHTCALLDDGS